MSRPNRARRPVNLTLSDEARAALRALAAGPPRQDMSRVVERLLLDAVGRTGPEVGK
jgi:hypothetical protein